MRKNAPISVGYERPGNGAVSVYHGAHTIAMPPLMCSVWPVM
jgi:hypothetical protein